jgi:hypothetical protein
MASATWKVPVAGVYTPLTTGIAKYNEKKWAAGAGGVRADVLSDLMGSRCTTSGTPIPVGASFGGIDLHFPEGGGSPPPDTKDVDPYVPGAVDIRCRYAIAWQPEPQSCGTPPNINCTENQGYDIDFCVTQAADGVLLGCASSWQNNYEFMEFQTQNHRVLRMAIYGYSGLPGHTAKVGWAFVCAYL